MNDSKIGQRPVLSAALIAMAGLALLLPAAPAAASEVVKLARLVITGKRLAAETGNEAGQQRIAQLPRVVIEGRRSEDTLQLAMQRRGLPRAL